MVSWKQKSVLFFVVFGITLDADFDSNNSLIEFYGLSDEKIDIVIKDNIDIKGEVTSAGSIALKDNIASENAFIIQKLIDANYNIAGKANLSEWANFRSEESVSGWSSLGGQTTHYLFNNFNPCGSSSGSAVAVASGIVDIAIGTEEEVLASMLKDSSQVTIKHQQISSPEIKGDLNKSIEGLIKLGTGILIVKRGKDGASYFDENLKRKDVKGFPVKILNVLGAGDAFASGFIYGLIQKWSIEKSIKMGNACGSHVVTKEGCANFMPTLEEALKIMNK